MTQSPILWGAGLACALGGAIAGTALGSTPALDRSTVETFYQSHEDGAYERVDAQELLPDHYPLLTRQGTVPVEELSDRGLYSQARYRSYYGTEPEFAYDPDTPSGRAPHYAANDASLRIGDPAPEPAVQPVDHVPQPLQLADGAASLPSAGQAKMIDVQATLAMR